MNQIPKISIDLDLPARERWIVLGVKIAPLVQILAESALEVAGDILPSFLQPLLKNSRSALIPNPLCRLISKEMTEEAIGLSEATGIPASLLVLSNCIYDFTQLCSAGAITIWPDPSAAALLIAGWLR